MLFLCCFCWSYICLLQTLLVLHPSVLIITIVTRIQQICGVLTYWFRLVIFYFKLDLGVHVLVLVVIFADTSFLFPIHDGHNVVCLFNTRRTTSRLVRKTKLSFIRPIRAILRFNSTVSLKNIRVKHFVSCILIGYSNEHITLLTNNKYFLKNSR